MVKNIDAECVQNREGNIEIEPKVEIGLSCAQKAQVNDIFWQLTKKTVGIFVLLLPVLSGITGFMVYKHGFETAKISAYERMVDHISSLHTKATTSAVGAEAASNRVSRLLSQTESTAEKVQGFDKLMKEFEKNSDGIVDSVGA